MHIKSVLILLFSGIILFGCDKTDELNKPEINVGSYTNMIINYYDTTLVGKYNDPQYFNIDINNDGTDDIQFESELWGSPAVGQNPKSVLKSVNKNVQIYGYQTNDTLFINRGTQIYNAPENKIEVYKYENHTCSRINENDSIAKITPSFKVIALDRENKIKISDTYKSAEITLIDDWYSFPPLSYNAGRDTTIIEYTTFYNDCNNFPIDEIKYVGIKFEAESKLAWIKFSVFDKYKILVLESGIQQ